MGALLRWLSLRHWLQHPVRTGLTLLGVALGVSVTLAVNLIGEEILSSHERSLEHIAGKAQLVVSAGQSGMERDLADRISQVPGVAHVEPLLEKVLIEPGKGPIVLLGIDFLGDDALRDIEAEEGDAEVIEDPIAFLNSRESVVVPRSFAAARGLKKGDAFELMTKVGRRRFVIRGLLKDKGPAKTFGGDVVMMYLDAAQVALELDQAITRVDLSGDDNLEPAVLKQRLQQELGEAYDVGYPLQRGARLEEMMSGLNQALSMMAVLAIWVGVLLAYNAVEISVRQRQRELAVLRALGAGRRAIMALVLLEAFVLGAGATALGVGVGFGLARGGLASTARTVSEIYVLVKVDEVRLTLWNLLPALFVGLFVPVAGAVRPARWVANQPPVAGLTRPPEEGEDRQGVRRGLVVGALLVAAGLVAFLSPQATLDPRVGQISFGFVVLASVFLAPAAVSSLARWLYRLFGSRLGAEATIAIDHVIRDRRRAALTVASLVAGVATVVTIATYVHSMTVTYHAWLNAALPANLYITSGATIGMTQNTPLDPKIGELFSALPEVEAVLHVRMQDVDYGGRPIKVLSVEVDDYLRRARPVILAGSVPAPGSLAHAPRALVSENIARRDHLRPGSTIRLKTPTGPKDLEVLAVIMDFTSDQGLVLVDRTIFIDMFRDPLVDTFDIFLRDPRDTSRMQQTIRQRWGEMYDLFVLTSTEFKAEGLRILDDFFQLMRLLELVTLLIAVLGVATTLIAAVLDRTQEVGVMRAVGSTPRQIVRIVLTEAAFLGGFSALLGAFIGSLTGALFLKSVIVATVGWSFPWRIPLSVLPTIVIAVTAASVLAGIYPALWAARQPTLESMRTE
ncbi:MAG: ABC transporter permease [Candidatus Schekmanbacteria bacterium]|nr:ABC transporter permease [Candidatus Schekmanbacteria bacterium]